MGQSQSEARANDFLRQRCFAHLISGTFHPRKWIVHANTAFLHQCQSLPYADRGKPQFVKTGRELASNVFSYPGRIKLAPDPDMGIQKQVQSR